MTNEEILKAAQSSQEDIGEYEKVVVRKNNMTEQYFFAKHCSYSLGL